MDQKGLSESTMEQVADRGKLVYIPIERIHPHPDNPRKDLGDLGELTDSIKANGILQNLTVVPFGEDFRVIIGHRRHAAATLAGMTELPCIVAEMTEEEQLSTMLVENMQRTDLTVFEQATSFQQLSMDFGKSTAEISAMSGFSEGTVRRRLKMAELDHTVLKEVSDRQISLMDFDKLAQIEDLEERNKALKEIGTNNFNQAVESQLRRQAIKKALPKVKKILKAAKAEKIESSETWGSKYDKIGGTIYLNRWDGESDLLPRKVKGQLYYALDERCGDLRFFEKHKKAKPEKRSAAEIEKEKKIAAQHEKVRELTALAYKLRSEFVGGISLNSKNMTAMLKGAISGSILRCIDYQSANRELYVEILGLDDSGYDSKRGEKAVAAFGELSSKQYPGLIYANFGDKENKGYSSVYKNAWPKHEPCPMLDALYGWLCSLGYEMSDDEKMLQDGTHPLFKED